MRASQFIPEGRVKELAQDLKDKTMSDADFEKKYSKTRAEVRGMMRNQSDKNLTESQLYENLHQWFKEKWVRFGPDGKIRGDCARGDDSEGKPKCLPQSKAQNLGKKGRASAASRKRREDPNPERSGKAINVNTKKKSNEGVAEGQLDEKCWDTHRQVGMKNKGGRQVPNCVPKESVEESSQTCSECGGPAFSDLILAEKQDACYNKVRSRYKVWPSAYASGALVQCRKKGAANWGNKSEGVAEGFSDIVKGVKRKVAGKTDPKEVEHTYGRIARSAIKHKTPDQAEKDIERYKKVSKVVNKEGVSENMYSGTDDTVGFSVNSEAAYNAVMARFGDSIDHDETSGIMYVPARMWPQVEVVAFDADGEGAVQADGLDEGEKIGGRHDADDFDDMVLRLKKLAGAGPMKTVYDPQKRVYRNMPTAQQPAKQPKK